jgi:3',5'-cyclic AMP phosphodiesterase CpdA
VVSGSDIASKDNTFHTAVEPSEPFTLVVYGDTRTEFYHHLPVVNRIAEHKPHLVLDTGDLVSDGRLLPLWDAFFYVTKDVISSAPYFPVLGNHEYNAQYYYDLFHLPEGGGKENEQWYSFNYGNVHFVCLDSNVLESAEQLAWLENDLAQAEGKTQWVFVTFHHAVYSSGEHGSYYDTMQDWVDVFERYGVDMVFNGHDHTYERSLSNNIWYIVTGGGGAPLRAVNQNPNPQQVYAETTLHFCKLRIDGTQIDFEMIRADGTTGDSMTITKSTALAPVNGHALAVDGGAIGRYKWPNSVRLLTLR